MKRNFQSVVGGVPSILSPRRRPSSSSSLLKKNTVGSSTYYHHVDDTRPFPSYRLFSSKSSSDANVVKVRRRDDGDQLVTRATTSSLPNDGLTLSDFVASSTSSLASNLSPPSNQRQQTQPSSSTKTFHIKTYGCQMNVNDSDIVRALLLQHGGFSEVSREDDADVLLTNTCSIREKAEQKVFQRLRTLRKRKGRDRIVGLLGCMAERLQESILEQELADLVIGPDSFRSLPNLLTQLFDEDDPLEQAINVQLSKDETYADILPVHDARSNVSNGESQMRQRISAFSSIQRGCDNRCSFCIVPFTRGKERSRPLRSIVEEIKHLREVDGIQEIVLLGQNVNSYHDRSEAALAERPAVPTLSLSNSGFRSRTKRPNFGGYTFVDLIEEVSSISPELRVRFTSPHPKDYPTELLHLMAERPNICNQIHLPAQSGSTTMLQRMKRGYSREAYLELVHQIWDIIPDVALSSDFIAGFCAETEDEHQDTISLLQHVKYEQAFLFAYSLREKTYAHRRLEDNVPAETKQRRLQEIIDTFREEVHKKNERLEVGKLRLVLVEGKSKRHSDIWSGRTDQNKRVLFPIEIETSSNDQSKVITRSGREVRASLETKQYLHDIPMSDVNLPPSELKSGDYAVVKITEAKGHTLRGELLWQTSLSDFAEVERRFLSKMTIEEKGKFRDLFRPLRENRSAA